MSDSIVIVGGGHAAAQLCATLVGAGHGARTRLLSREPFLPYQRPALSKDYLRQDADVLQLHRDAAWYSDGGVQISLGTTVYEIDRRRRRVVLDGGAEVSYGKLVLATGARARTHPAVQPSWQNVHGLRSAYDAARLRGDLRGGGELCVLGGGFIGLEVAATARDLGWEVQVLEVAPRLLARAVSPTLGQHILEVHQASGVRVRLGVTVEKFEGSPHRLTTLDVDGRPLLVDRLLLAIGAVPETELAHAAGLVVGNGIEVDPAMRTSDPDILAVGDCASFEWAGRRVRLESVQNANEQAKVAAATIVGQSVDSAPFVPTFWSDQGKLKLQMTGLWREGLHTVRREGKSAAHFSLFHFAGSELIAVESANSPVDQMWARRLMSASRAPSFEQAADPAFQLKTLL